MYQNITIIEVIDFVLDHIQNIKIDREEVGFESSGEITIEKVKIVLSLLNDEQLIGIDTARSIIDFLELKTGVSHSFIGPLILDSSGIDIAKITEYRNQLIDKVKNPILNTTVLRKIARHFSEKETKTEIINILRESKVPSYFISTAEINPIEEVLIDIFNAANTSPKENAQKELFGIIQKITESILLGEDTKQARKTEEYLHNLLIKSGYGFDDQGEIIKFDTHKNPMEGDYIDFWDNFFISRKGEIVKNGKLIGKVGSIGRYFIERLKKESCGAKDFKPLNKNARYAWSTIVQTKLKICKYCGEAVLTDNKDMYQLNEE